MSDTVITSLVAIGGKNQITAIWEFTDPHQYGALHLRHRFFRLERSTSPDMSAADANAVFDTTWTSTVGVGVTLYHRVRSVNESGYQGAWSDIVSGSEESTEDTEWAGSFSGVAAAVSVGVGSVSASGDMRYRKTGLTVFFGASFSISSLTGASGFLRVGNIPHPKWSGSKYAANATYITGGGDNRLLTAAVVDAGGGQAAVDLFMYSGAFAGALEFYTVSGFYETVP